MQLFGIAYILDFFDLAAIFSARTIVRRAAMR